jgi:hypothetical protein
MSRAIRMLDALWFERAPATRPAILRVLVGLYTMYYLAPRYSMYIKIARSDPSLFKRVGVASPLQKPIPVGVFRAMLASTFVANVLFVLGFRHRYTGPLFVGLLLWVMSYRNSWSMIYHSNNVLILHAMILGLSRSADALSVDSLVDATESEDLHWRYGWPIRLMNTVTAPTYFLAGVAKVKGPLGWKWGGGESLRAQIAVDGIRKEADGSQAAPLAYVLHNNLFLFTIMGIGSLVLELAAPLSLVNKRLSQLWATGAFQLHWGIFMLMKIRFRYQMAGLIFAPFFDLDRIPKWIELRGARRQER